MKNNHMKELTKGFFEQNPVFVIALGLCPVLGVSTQVSNALGMAAGVFFVLLFSNIIISMLRNVIPGSIHIPAYIVVIASLVTVTEMVMHAFVPAVYSALGVYLPLIVVNCIILGRAEAFASGNTVLDSALDAIGMSIGFGMAITLIAVIRELL
ncbi:MAG TPA: electron transport complex subunit RsxE, partial [Sphaerochaeta sp.]|nr:electron transport complex subunit RsxE [Sphaerochaeta sp.]